MVALTPPNIGDTTVASQPVGALPQINPNPVPQTALGSGAVSMSPASVNPSQPQGPALPPTAPPAQGTEQAPALAAPMPEAQPASPEGNPEVAQQIVDQSAERAKNADEETKKKVAGFAFDFDKAYDEWVEKFGGRVKQPDLKSKEEKALFVMDFGFRMMHVASQWQQSPAGAMGAAMIGAKGEQERRVNLAREQDMNVQKSALDAATSMEGAHNRALTVDRGELLTTQEGYFARMPDNTLVPIMDENGKIVMPTGRDQKQYAAQWHYDMLLKAGYDHRQAVDILNGAATPAEMNAAAAKHALTSWEKFVEGLPGGPAGSAVPPGGKERKRVSEWTAEERRAWQENAKREAIEMFTSGVYQSGSGALGGGLPPGGALDVPPPSPTPMPQPGAGGTGRVLGRAPDNPYPVTSDADFQQVPSGSYYAGPDGQVRRKP